MLQEVDSRWLRRHFSPLRPSCWWPLARHSLHWTSSSFVEWSSESDLSSRHRLLMIGLMGEMPWPTAERSPSSDGALLPSRIQPTLVIAKIILTPLIMTSPTAVGTLILMTSPTSVGAPILMISSTPVGNVTINWGSCFISWCSPEKRTLPPTINIKRQNATRKINNPMTYNT